MTRRAPASWRKFDRAIGLAATLVLLVIAWSTAAQLGLI